MHLSVRRVSATSFHSISLYAFVIASAIIAPDARAEEIVVNQTGAYTLNRATPITGGPRTIDVTVNGVVTLVLDDVTATSAVSNGAGVSVKQTGTSNINVRVGDVVTSGPGQARGISIDHSFIGSTVIDAKSVTTSGAASDAINVFPGVGSTIITVDAVTTTGTNSNGIVAVRTSSSDLTVNAGSVNVSGSGALGIRLSTYNGKALVNVQDMTVADGRGVLVGGSTSATITARNISTGGVQGIAAHAGSSGAGPVQVTTTGLIRTTGERGFGVYLAGGSSQINALNSGAIVTTGAGGLGILATSGTSSSNENSIAITNRGEIQTSGGVTVGDGGTPVHSNGIWVVSRALPVFIDNSGLINTTGAGASAILVESGAGVASFGYGGGPGGPINIVNSGTITASGGSVNAVTLANGGNSVLVDNSGSIKGNLSFNGGGSDRLTSSGSIIGNVDLGGGDDTLVLQGAWSLQGTVSGGIGNDTLRLVAAAAGGALELNGSAFASFETTSFTGGTVAINGNYTSALDVQAGYLFGRSGSTLNGDLAVASGATFGSAGTVIGNVNVAGTLSPGASPGTMTVIGNVNLASGSSTLFEITPTVSDQLLVSGALNIASGATLTLTGTRPLTPGVTLDLVKADEGITGSFTTINKPQTIEGFLSQSANKLSLLGTFLIGPDVSPQVNSTIGYVNKVLVAGQASPALLAAVPSLLTSTGASNAAVFQQISPEVYASSSQLGAEQALTLVEAARSQLMNRPSNAGIFTFGQMLYNHRDMDGDATYGISAGRLQTYGGMAGIGLARGDGWVGAFAGYLDGHQTIAGLSARTNADGVMAGIQGAWNHEAFRFDGMIGYIGGDAHSRRTLLTAPLSSEYALRSWIWDARASYGQSLGGGWNLRPSFGLTGIRTTRGAITEKDNSPFALNVAKDVAMRWFLNSELQIQGGQADGSVFHPFAAIGIQRRLDGRNSGATASFAGVTTSYRLSGIERAQTLATAKIGISYRLTERLGLFATYAGEFGNETRHNGSVGLRLAL